MIGLFSSRYRMGMKTEFLSSPESLSIYVTGMTIPPSL